MPDLTELSDAARQPAVERYQKLQLHLERNVPPLHVARDTGAAPSHGKALGPALPTLRVGGADSAGSCRPWQTPQHPAGAARSGGRPRAAGSAAVRCRNLSRSLPAPPRRGTGAARLLLDPIAPSNPCRPLVRPWPKIKKLLPPSSASSAATSTSSVACDILRINDLSEVRAAVVEAVREAPHCRPYLIVAKNSGDDLNLRYGDEKLGDLGSVGSFLSGGKTTTQWARPVVRHPSLPARPPFALVSHQRAIHLPLKGDTITGSMLVRSTADAHSPKTLVRAP